MAKKLSPIVARLHRLQGQLTGVETMIAAQTPASKVLQQLEAVRGSIVALEEEMLSEKIKEIQNEELKRSLRYLLKI